MRLSLESEIDRAWWGANELLRSENPDLREVDWLISELLLCATQLNKSGLSGEREILWLIKRLNGLKTPLCEMPYYLD